MTNDGKTHLPDGCEKIWNGSRQSKRWSTITMSIREIQKSNLSNELEWIEGKIYTNVWQKTPLQ
jgi:glutamine cyclotransferase